MSPPSRLPFLQTFGHPALLERPGGAQILLRRKDLALLAFLRAEPDALVPRSRLSTLLWANATDERARHSLSQALSRLQRVLPPGALAADAQAVRLVVRISCDLDDWAAAATAGGGPVVFLDGFDPGAGAEDFVEWLDRRRAALARTLLEQLEAAGVEAEAREEWPAALAIGGRAVELDPYWERGHRRMMRALDALGERTRALRHCDEFAAWLGRQTGDPPDAETLALAARIRHAPAARPVAAPPAGAAAAAALPSLQRAPHPTSPVHQAEPADVAGRSGSMRRKLMAAGMAMALLGFAGALLARGTGFGRVAETGAAVLAAGPADGACRAGPAVARFVGESYPDNVPVQPGERFVKSWTFKNTGTCAWDEHFSLRYESYRPQPLSTSHRRIALHRTVPPGDTVAIQVPMEAPAAPGLYREDWSFRDPEGAVVQVSSSRTIWARIMVPAANLPRCTADNAVAKFVREDHPDDSEVVAGRPFVKTWVLRNGGACAWGPEFALRIGAVPATRLSGGESVPLGHTVAPGEEHAFQVAMRAPGIPGTYREDWWLADGRRDTIHVSGSRTVWVQVVVPGTFSN